MQDNAISSLEQTLIRGSGRALWLIDEQTDVTQFSSMANNSELQCLTNRIDQLSILETFNIDSRINDFDISGIAAPQRIFHRISKQKALVHHIINQAADLLPANGELWLSGFKSEGIKTYLKKAQDRLGGSLDIKRGKNSLYTGSISMGRKGNVLKDDDYAVIRPAVHEDDKDYYSKPGVYGWQKIDSGSRILKQQLIEAIAPTEKSLEILDLGCGYGYLSVAASALGKTSITATDNNLAAISSCRKNFEIHNITGQCVLADCGEGIDQLFDLVICNPPFHQGFSVDGDLTERFLTSARNHLKKDGMALFVVNEFIALPKKASALSFKVSELSHQSGFRVYKLNL
ncbi:MAG: methyltransferase [Pseudomonadales bacterium]